MGSTSPMTKGKRGSERETNVFLVSFRQFVSLLAMAHNDVGETDLKRALGLTYGPVPLTAATYNIFQN